MRPAPDDASLSPEHRDTAFVRWIVADSDAPDAAAVAEELARAICREAAALGCARIDVSSRNAFGTGWFGVPDAWPHVIEGLARAGFAAHERWVVCHSSKAATEAHAPPDACDLDWAEDLEMDEWKLSARRGGELVGECEAWGVPDHLKGAPGAGEWVTVELIEVEERYRRRGWGRWLLRELLRRQAEGGRPRAVLWTERGNRPMLGLLRSLGFERGPECVCMARDL